MNVLILLQDLAPESFIRVSGVGCIRVFKHQNKKFKQTLGF